jgi:hypothetical protein
MAERYLISDRSIPGHEEGGIFDLDNLGKNVAFSRRMVQYGNNSGLEASFLNTKMRICFVGQAHDEKPT